MSLLSIFRRNRNQFTSPRVGSGPISSIALETVKKVLEDSSRHILLKDLTALHEVFAGGALVYVWDGEPRTKRVQVTREAYLAMMAAEFAKHALASYRIEVDKVLSESKEKWSVETVSRTGFSDGTEELGRQRVQIEVIEGHALITSLELRVPNERHEG